MAYNPLWKFLALLLLAALGLMGCAGLSQDISQEIKQDRLEARQKMAEAEKNYESHKNFGYSSENSDNWNATDWSLWMDMHGGGR